MKDYICKKCDRRFKQKCHLDNHLQKKNPCDTLLKKSILSTNFTENENTSLVKSTNFTENNKISLKKSTNLSKIQEFSTNFNKIQTNFLEDNKNPIINSQSIKQYINDKKCIYCYKKFARKENVIYHLTNSCKRKKEITKEKEMIFDQLKKLKDHNDNLEEQKNNLEKQNKLLIDKVDKIERMMCENKNYLIQENIDNSTNINNHQQNNVLLSNYGQEDLSKIDKKLFLKAAKRGFNTPVEVTRAIHFNDDHPEYHNIFIPRINEKHAMVYKEDKWRLMNKNDLIDDLYDQKKAFIEDNFDEFYDSLDEHKKKTLMRWLDANDDDQGIINTKESLKNLLYEEKDLAMDYKKECRKKQLKKS